MPSAQGMRRTEILPLAAGVAVRLWLYLSNDSFWRDESMVLLNIARKSFVDLTGVLDYHQEAPIPWLWLYRLLFLTGGGGELPLRFVSLAASCAALALFFLLARRVLPDRRAALFVTWLLALSPGAVHFAALAKPYSGDLLIAVALTWLAAPWLLDLEKPPSLGRLTTAAALAPWFSFPAHFVVASLAGALLLRWRQVGGAACVRFLLVVGASVGVHGLVILQRIRSPLRRDMLGHLTSTDLLQPANWKWLVGQILHALWGPARVSSAMQPPEYLLTGVVGALLLGLAGLGLWAAWRRGGGAWVVMLAGPLALALLASLLRLYVPYGRLLLFATAGLYLRWAMAPPTCGSACAAPGPFMGPPPWSFSSPSRGLSRPLPDRWMG